MNAFTRAFYAAIALLFFTSCATRIPVTKPDDLVWWVGKTVEFKREFHLVRNYAGSDAAPYRDSTAYVGENYPFNVKKDQPCKVLRFYRNSESEGKFVFAVLSTTTNGQTIEFEFMFLPSSDIPGRNDAERVAIKLRSSDAAWTLQR